MTPAAAPAPERLRALLVLARASNLPTVWSNVLCAVLLAGGVSGGEFVLLLAAASLLYTGGMYLNDACDAAFDRRFRPERPIPAGAVEARLAWGLGLAMLAAGFAGFAALGRLPAALAALLVAAILAYDVLHKAVPFAPVLMALCRFLLLLAAAAAGGPPGGHLLWTALALGAYVVGLSHVARRESTGGATPWWPLLPLLAPALLALLMNPAEELPRVAVLLALHLVWTLRALSHLWRKEPAPGRCVAALLAGMPLVDLLAVAPDPWPLGAAFLALFGLGLAFQRVVPAT
jgi:4-hydroxybenzoate polyprenyltransferase